MAHSVQFDYAFQSDHFERQDRRPEKTLHQLLIDMEEELDSVRSRVAEAANGVNLSI
jgi:phage shock protein A